MMTILSKVKKGLKVKVHSFESELDIKPAVIGMGLLPGDEITIISESFLGSPLTIRGTSGQTLALRKSEASLINVEIVK